MHTHATDTHTHILIWTSTPTNMLNIDDHWWSQHTRVVSWGSRGLQLCVLCMNTSLFLRFYCLQQQTQSKHPLTVLIALLCGRWVRRQQKSLWRLSSRSEFKNFKHKDWASRTEPLRVEDQSESKTDPSPAHPVGLLWQRVTWLPLVTGATGPDASGELEWGEGGLLKSSGRRLKEFNEDEESVFYLLFTDRSFSSERREQPAPLVSCGEEEIHRNGWRKFF